MVNEIIIPKENTAQAEEVRELENKDLAQQSEQQQKKSEEKPTITENVKETVLPVAHASDDEERQKEGVRQVTGYTLGTVDAVNPAVGGVASGVTTIEEGIGKLTGNEEMAKGGKVVRQSALQPLKDLGKGIKNLFE
jgi:hypothetical protein